MIPSHTVLETVVWYPCYCFTCGRFWFEKEYKKVPCKRCGSENMNIAKRDKAYINEKGLKK